MSKKVYFVASDFGSALVELFSTREEMEIFASKKASWLIDEQGLSLRHIWRNPEHEESGFMLFNRKEGGTVTINFGFQYVYFFKEDK